MITGIQIDGITYDMVVSVKRTAKVVSSDLSGVLLDGTYYNDVLYTTFEYLVKIAVPLGRESEYADMYEALTDPVSEHEFILPYNQTNISLRGRISVVDDEFFGQTTHEGQSVNLWRGISFRITSNHADKSWW